MKHHTIPVCFLMWYRYRVSAGVAIRGRLIITPRNQFTAGTQVIMNCSSTLGSSAIIWTFIPANQSVNATIASGSTVYPPFTQLYWIDQPTTNDSNLIIRKPNASTAGTFTCSDNEMLARAELLVFCEYPIALSRRAYDKE